LSTLQPDRARTAAFAAARDRVLATIGEAAARAGRDPATVTLVAVSKTVAPERLVDAVAAGLTTLGENRVQEAEEKVALVVGATWHLVGPLQSNKAKRALATFAMIESVDTIELAQRLDRLAADVRPGERVPILLQVNVDEDPAKAGFDPEVLAGALPELAGLERLDIRGLMTVGRMTERPEDARPTFVALRALSERLRTRPAESRALGAELSMGMSGDYEIAVEEGATIVRVGQALFGQRHHH
jgi:pyridoxal phosphate enzyme (YggS family)